MTKDVEIRLSDKILNTTMRRVLPVKVWSKTLSASKFGLRCSATANVKITASTIRFISAGNSAKARVSLTAKVSGTAKCNGMGTTVTGSVKFYNVYLLGKIDSNFKTIKFTAYGTKARIQVKVKGITMFNALTPVNLSVLNQTITLPANKYPVKVPSPANKNLVFNLKNVGLKTTSGVIVASANIKV